MSALKHDLRHSVLSSFSRLGSLFAPQPTVLMYHSVNTSWDRMGLEFEIFRKGIYQLKESGVHFLQLDDLAASFESLPKKSVLLTFDDGLKDNYTHAVPFLRELQIPAVFFISTDFFGKPFVRSEFECMSVDEVREIAHDPLFEIGSHAQSHRRFTTLSESEARGELSESKRLLESTIGTPIRSVAFPYGSHRAEHIQYAIEAGYRSIFTTIQRRLSSASVSSVGLPRFVVNTYTAPFLPYMIYPGYEWYWRVYEKSYRPLRRLIPKE